MYTYTIFLINKTNSFCYNINTIDGMLIMLVNLNYNNSAK